MSFCKSSDNEASVTIFFDNPITVTFNKPPVFVGFSEAEEIRLLDRVAETNTLVALCPRGFFAGTEVDRLYYFCEGGTYKAMMELPAPLHIERSRYGGYTYETDKTTVVFQSIFYDDSAANGNCTPTPGRYEYIGRESSKTIFWVSDQETIYSWSVQQPPGYKILCDGCQPEECKGSYSKYPGYRCLPCQEIESRLTRIGRKIDGITK